VTRQQGLVAEWNDERGFGFITPAAGGPRVFAHVSAFPRGRRPAGDDEVTYAVRRDERSRLVAAEVQYVGRGRPRRTGTRGLLRVLLAVTLFVVLLVGLAVLDRAPFLLLVLYLVTSAAAFMMYREDKLAAQRGTWRIPESNLHAVALVGGWPGALIAQRVYRHKTTKQPFRTIFWITVAANCVALACFVYAAPLTSP